jgi:uncharacterized protein YqeY
MSIASQLTDDIKQALKSRDSLRLSTLRYALAAIRRREVDERRSLEDTEVIQILTKLIHQHEESAEAFRKAGREPQAQAAEEEIRVVSSYLPPRLERAELLAVIDRIITETHAQKPQDIGRVMGRLKVELAGRADLAQVSAEVKTRLTG